MKEIFDAESQIIGGLLLFPEECMIALEELSKDSFESYYAANAFQGILDAHKDGKAFDAAIFISSITSLEVREYVLQAAQTFLTTANYDGYIESVKTSAGRRRVTKQIQDMAFNGTDYDEMVSRLTKIVEDEKSNTKQENIGDFLTEYVTQIYEPFDPNSRIYTGFTRLDKALGGLRKGSLCYIGAFPSTGKTSLAINAASHNLDYKKRVLFFSLEMSKTQILDRLFSSKLKIDYGKIDRKQLSDEEKDAIMQATSNIFSDKDLLICDDVYSIEAMAGKISRFKPDLVVVDFLQNIRTTDKYQTRKNQVDYISSELKRLARVNNCAMVVLSQLSRSNEKPTMSSLKESGNLEADGDYIMLLYRPFVTDKTGKFSPEQTEILLDKNKFGSCGKIDLKFRCQVQTFEEIETRYDER